MQKNLGDYSLSNTFRKIILRDLYPPVKLPASVKQYTGCLPYTQKISLTDSLGTFAIEWDRQDVLGFLGIPIS